MFRVETPYLGRSGTRWHKIHRHQYAMFCWPALGQKTDSSLLSYFYFCHRLCRIYVQLSLTVWKTWVMTSLAVSYWICLQLIFSLTSGRRNRCIASWDCWKLLATRCGAGNIIWLAHGGTWSANGIGSAWFALLCSRHVVFAVWAERATSKSSIVFPKSW